MGKLESKLPDIKKINRIKRYRCLKNIKLANILIRSISQKDYKPDIQYPRATMVAI
jgi:hypothetical protein